MIELTIVIVIDESHSVERRLTGAGLLSESAHPPAAAKRLRMRYQKGENALAGQYKLDRGYELLAERRPRAAAAHDRKLRCAGSSNLWVHQKMPTGNHHQKPDAEHTVSKFYNEIGWQTCDGTTEDARRFEDLRRCASEYVSKCRLRVLRHIPNSGENIIDMASGPIQYPEYLEYSKGFKKRYCIDLSVTALSEAKNKISQHGIFIQGNFLNIPLQENFFDCAISLHTIYHIDKNMQEAAVRKLLRITKPGQPVIIVYSNPRTLLSRIAAPVRWTKRKMKSIINADEKHDLYSFSHPIEWWDRFHEIAEIQIWPWRSLDTRSQKIIIPDNAFGKKILQMLFSVEDRFPVFFAKYFQYPMIVLRKK